MDFLTNLHLYQDWALLALRLAVGAIFLAHGTQKFAMWKMKASEQMPSGMLSVMMVLSVAETAGGAALIVGFLTQSAGIGLGVIMLGAIWMKISKWKKKFTGDGGWELDLVLFASAALLACVGAGVISLDNVFFGI